MPPASVSALPLARSLGGGGPRRLLAYDGLHAIGRPRIPHRRKAGDPCPGKRNAHLGKRTVAHLRHRCRHRGFGCIERDLARLIAMAPGAEGLTDLRRRTGRRGKPHRERDVLRGLIPIGPHKLPVELGGVRPSHNGARERVRQAEGCLGIGLMGRKELDAQAIVLLGHGKDAVVARLRLARARKLARRAALHERGLNGCDVHP